MGQILSSLIYNEEIERIDRLSDLPEVIHTVGKYWSYSLNPSSLTLTNDVEYSCHDVR